MGVKSIENWQNTGRAVYYDEVTYETLRTDFPVYFEDDFTGYSLQKYTANENTTAKWRTVETSLNTAIALATDDHHVSMVLDSDDNTEIACLYFGDHECFSLEREVVFETRLAFSTLPTTGTETVQAVWGLAGSHNATLDSIDCNAWFRLESAANTVLLWETDDNATNDDDNSAGVILAANGWRVFRIQAVDSKPNVKFFVDGVEVGSSNMSGLSTTVGDVQPYLRISKTKASGNTGTGTMLIDYVRIWENRA